MEDTENMKIVTITDRTARQCKTEYYQNKEIAVQSRSGLHPAESALIDTLHALGHCTSLLVVGNRTGAAAMAAAILFPECRITCHTHDAHHAAAIVRNLNGNAITATLHTDPFVTTIPPVRHTASGQACTPAHGESAHPERFTVACTSRLPEESFDCALFMITPETAAGELTLDLLENIHQVLRENGECLLAYDGESARFTKQLKKTFATVRTLRQSRKNALFLCTKRGEREKPRSFQALFDASLAGTRTVSLLSLPGVFCHRRPDNGGLALAETAAPLLRPGVRVSDFGCGCGMVGILLAQKEPSVRIAFTDSSVRALDAACRNIRQLGIEGAELILSDSGSGQRGFDMFVGNPPYFSNYRIAELFIEEAYQSLRTGGQALLVARNAAVLEKMMRERFGNGESVSRRGYTVVISNRMP